MKRLVRKALRKVGWELTCFRPESCEWARLKSMLSAHGVDTVLDVGANTGLYARNLRDAGFKGRIVSFEPTSEAHSQLCRIARNDPLWTVAERMAIGDWDGQTQIHVANNSVSSSLLPMLASHREADPESGFVATEVVSIARLDSITPRFLEDGKSIFIKIDVQGFEKQVLDGALKLLDRTVGLQLELSLTPLYEGETLFQPMVEYLRAIDFDLWALMPGFVDKRNGRVLQVDGVFFQRRGEEQSLNTVFIR
jgi:FkbM family methyltransferase